MAIDSCGVFHIGILFLRIDDKIMVSILANLINTRCYTVDINTQIVLIIALWQSNIAIEHGHS